MKSLIIGISAFNEELNISRLLRDIEHQVLPDEVSLDKIVLISDGSTDNTVTQAQTVNNSRLVIINDGLRLGLAARLNQIFEMATTDVVILLNADIRLVDPDCFSKLIQPILNQDADLVSCPIIASPAATFVQRALSVSMNLKNDIFDAYQNGDNVYTCHGPARAFAKALYSQLRFPHSVGEDAYSYLYAKRHGFSYAYASTTHIIYHLPATLADHQKQSHRYQQSKKQFVDDFGIDFVKEAYRLPNEMIFHTTLKYIRQAPIEVLLYAGFTILATMNSWRHKPVPTAWSIASSSKK